MKRSPVPQSTLFVRVPRSLHTQLKKAAAAQGLSMNDLATRFLLRSFERPVVLGVPENDFMPPTVAQAIEATNGRRG